MKNILFTILILILSSCKNDTNEINKSGNNVPANNFSEAEIDTILNKRLVAILDTIYQDDQELRSQISIVNKEFGRESLETKALWKAIKKKDSVNHLKVQELLDNYGWLGEDVIGGSGNKTLFLVIQHAPIETQVKYLPMMRDAVKKGNTRAVDLAMLEDRVALRTGKRQIYGSQIGRDPNTGEYYVAPIEDPENVEERRTTVGLGSLADYVSGYNITWDVEEHKRKTALLEANRN